MIDAFYYQEKCGADIFVSLLKLNGTAISMMRIMIA